jgi:hypothetical protein
MRVISKTRKFKEKFPLYFRDGHRQSPYNMKWSQIPCVHDFREVKNAPHYLCEGAKTECVKCGARPIWIAIHKELKELEDLGLINRERPTSWRGLLWECLRKWWLFPPEK